MKKDVRDKMFPRMAHRIMACQLDWLVTSASQRTRRGLIHMTTLFPLFCLSQFVCLSSSLPPPSV